MEMCSGRHAVKDRLKEVFLVISLSVSYTTIILIFTTLYFLQINTLTLSEASKKYI